MKRRHLVSMLAVAAATTALAAPSSAGDPSAAVISEAANVEDDVLQITLDRLVAEAPDFGSFVRCEGIVNPCDVGTYAQISVIRLDTGEHAEVNGETAQVSLSSVKVQWVTMAVDELGIDAIEPYVQDIFARSDDVKAGQVIDLLGDPPSDGIDFVNAATAAWGLGDTWVRGWYHPRVASTPPPEGMGVWGTNNYTTPDDLAAFWVLLSRGELLGPEETAQVLEWAALPRPHEANELITNRLPAAIAAGVAHKTGWSDAGRNRRIDGGLVITPDGVEYAIVVSFRAGSLEAFHGGAADWARYASCEIYNVIAGTGHTCTRTGDPYRIVNHTTAPIGALNTATAERDRVQVGGWALDRDAGAGPIDVRITVDGATVGTITADRLKTAVHDRRGMGSYHGFKAALDVNLSPGDHRVCAVAINDSALGSNRSIGCKTVVVPEDWPPAGILRKAFINGTHLVVKGWAYDRDTPGPIEVKITVDGEWAAKIRADRGSTGRVFRTALSIHLAAGGHTVCAIAINHENAGPNRSIGCLVVEAPSDWPPMGSLKSTSISVDSGNIIARGWASDWDTADAIDVTITLDGVPIRRVTADGGPGGNRFRSGIPVPLPQQEYEVCAIAINHTGGDPTTPLGCDTIVVTDL